MPRSLKLPEACKLSSLSHTSRPQRCDKAVERTRGVERNKPAARAPWATHLDAMVMAVAVGAEENVKQTKNGQKQSHNNDNKDEESNKDNLMLWFAKTNYSPKEWTSKKSKEV